MNIVLLHSGGIYSTVLLHELLERGHTIEALSVDYALNPRAELLASKRIVFTLPGVKRSEIYLPGLENVLPEGKAHNRARRLALVGVAVAYTQRVKAGGLALADTSEHELARYRPHRGDKLDWVRRLTIFLECDVDLEVLVPHLGMTRAEVLRKGWALKAPLWNTWSCLENGPRHCGVCSGCTIRKRAFRAARLHDATFYADGPALLPFDQAEIARLDRIDLEDEPTRA